MKKEKILPIALIGVGIYLIVTCFKDETNPLK